jgi:hypothetical protein
MCLLLLNIRSCTSTSAAWRRFRAASFRASHLPLFAAEFERMTCTRSRFARRSCSSSSSSSSYRARWKLPFRSKSRWMRGRTSPARYFRWTSSGFESFFSSSSPPIRPSSSRRTFRIHCAARMPFVKVVVKGGRREVTRMGFVGTAGPR